MQSAKVLIYRAMVSVPIITNSNERRSDWLPLDQTRLSDEAIHSSSLNCHVAQTMFLPRTSNSWSGIYVLDHFWFGHQYCLFFAAVRVFGLGQAAALCCAFAHRDILPMFGHIIFFRCPCAIGSLARRAVVFLGQRNTIAFFARGKLRFGRRFTCIAIAIFQRIAALRLLAATRQSSCQSSCQNQ
jgi:hypothetical protein